MKALLIDGTALLSTKVYSTVDLSQVAYLEYNGRASGGWETRDVLCFSPERGELLACLGRDSKVVP
jgi:hypothetical protein